MAVTNHGHFRIYFFYRSTFINQKSLAHGKEGPRSSIKPGNGFIRI